MRYFYMAAVFVFVAGCQQAEMHKPFQPVRAPEEIVSVKKESVHPWISLNTQCKTIFPSRLTDVYFWTDDRGVTVGSAGVFLTLNGGISWERLSLKPEVMVGAQSVPVDWMSVRMTSPDDIFVLGQAGQGTSKQLFVYKSSNAGKTWDRVYYHRLKYRDRITLATDVLKQFGEQRLLTMADDGQMQVADAILEELGSSIRIKMTGLESMMILGGLDQTFTSDDSGKTWKKLQWSDPFIPADVCFPGDVSYGGDSIGYAVGTGFAGGIAFKTKDGGVTWDRLELPPGISSLKCCYFVNSIKGMIAGEEGVVYLTTDGGKSWSDCSLFVGDTVSDIVLAQSGIGWVSISGKNSSESGSVYFTRDNGKTWGSELSGYKYIARMYSVRPGRVVGVGHVPHSNSDLVVLYEASPSKAFIQARRERTEIRDITPVLKQSVKVETLKPVEKPAEPSEPKEFEKTPDGTEIEQPSPVAEKDEIKAPVPAAVISIESEEKSDPGFQKDQQEPEIINVDNDEDPLGGFRRFFRRMFMLESDPEFKD